MAPSVTRAMASKADFTFIVKTILGQKPDSPISKAFDTACIHNALDILNICAQDVKSLMYSDASDPSVDVKLLSGHHELIWCFQKYVRNKTRDGEPMHRDWKNLFVQADFEAFRLHFYPDSVVPLQTPSPSATESPTHRPTTIPSKVRDRAFEDNKQRDSGHQTLRSKTGSQDAADTLDPSNMPNNIALFDEKATDSIDGENLNRQVKPLLCSTKEDDDKTVLLAAGTCVGRTIPTTEDDDGMPQSFLIVVTENASEQVNPMTKLKCLVGKDEDEKSLSYDEVMQLVEKAHDILVSGYHDTTTALFEKLFDVCGYYQGNTIETEISFEPALTMPPCLVEDEIQEISSLDKVIQLIVQIDDDEETGHDDPVNKKRSSWKRDRFNVVSEWITADDPVSSVTNATDRGLLNKDGRERFNSPTKRDRLITTSTLVEEDHPALEDSRWHPGLNAEVQFHTDLQRQDVDKVEFDSAFSNCQGRESAILFEMTTQSETCDQIFVGNGTIEDNIRERDTMSRLETATLYGESKSGPLLGSPSWDPFWRVKVGTTPGMPNMTRVHHFVYADKHDGRHKVRLRLLFSQGDATSLLTKENSMSPNSVLSRSLGSDNSPRLRGLKHEELS
jgi:hypothetical protein